MELHGFLNIDKPLGWTSHDVVGRLRRILKTRKIGHAGTLDPAATGVLIAGVGRATRFLDYVQSGSKSYVAHVVLGIESESADIDGRVMSFSNEPNSAPSGLEIENVLSGFVGHIEQVPPKYSAVKQDGEPIYRKMRRGEDVEVPTRRVRVDSVSIVSYRCPDLVLSVDCGSGVYIRSLARDIGERLGTTAYLHHLIRTRVGQFNLAGAVDIESLADVRFPETWTSFAAAIDSGLAEYAALSLDRESTDAWYHGRSIVIRSPGVGQLSDPVRIYSDSAVFAGIALPESTTEGVTSLRPRIVLPPRSSGV